jgi:hypothetical protein
MKEFVPISLLSTLFIIVLSLSAYQATMIQGLKFEEQ